MPEVSNLLIGVRDVGESIISTSQDIRLVLKTAEENDGEKISSFKHSANLVEHILSMLVYLSAVEYKELDRYKELSNEVRRIEFSCLALRSILLDYDNYKTYSYISKKMELENLLILVNKAAYKLITISFLAKLKAHKSIEAGDRESGNLKQVIDEDHKKGVTKLDGSNDAEICYKTKDLCEEDCFSGTCYEDVPEDDGLKNNDGVCYNTKDNCEQNCDGTCYESYENDQLDENGKCYDTEMSCLNECTSGVCYDLSSIEYRQSMNCPDNTEVFTESTLTHVESGYKEDSEDIVEKEKSDEVKYSFQNLFTSGFNEKKYSTVKYFIEVILMAKINYTDYYRNITKNETTIIFEKDHTTENYESIVTEEQSTVETNTERDETTTAEYETTTELYEPSTDTYESVTESFVTTEEDTTDSYESTTQTYTSTEECTTQSYETTTEDLYKVSQDIYAVAQDLSTKANEISSMSSDISSKVSDISSMVNDLNSYDDDELSKKVQSISKMTQEISSKTSEISTLSSTTSSLSSDISSASSDMTTADRNHPYRTSPWEKMSNKGQDMITATQAIITAAQDILLKIDSIVSATADMVVADKVATLGYDITSRTQRLISETLNIMSAVIDLMNVFES